MSGVATEFYVEVRYTVRARNALGDGHVFTCSYPHDKKGKLAAESRCAELQTNYDKDSKPKTGKRK